MKDAAEVHVNDKRSALFLCVLPSAPLLPKLSVFPFYAIGIGSGIANDGFHEAAAELLAQVGQLCQVLRLLNGDVDVFLWAFRNPVSQAQRRQDGG